MKILFLTQVLPLPLDAGPKVRSFYVLRYLAEAGHQITLLSLVRETDSPESVRQLEQWCHSIHTIPIRRSLRSNLRNGIRSLKSSLPFLILRDQVIPMQKELERLRRRNSYDFSHADQIWMAPYVTHTQAGEKTVLDQHNAVFQIPKRLAEHEQNPLKKWFLNFEARKMARFEVDTCLTFDHVVWVTRQDLSALSKMASAENGMPNSDVIPICVDPEAQKPLRLQGTRFRITFLGGMHWPPNAEGVRWFAERVWPHLREKLPEAVFTILGKSPPDLESDFGCERLHAPGFVADPKKYLTETAVFVVPLLSGGGMRVKILDAWCWGVPVVSTEIGAEGLLAVNGENLLIADHPQQFTDQVARIFQDQTLAGRLSANGRATIESHYDWRKVYPSWDRIYR